MYRQLVGRAYRSSIIAHRLLSGALLARQSLRIGVSGGRPGGRCDVTVTPVDELPALAWLCRREGPRFQFWLGPGVERWPRGFFEGVWTGDFTRFDEIAGRLHFGSGALFGATRVLFLPPKHPLEFIYVLRDERRDVDLVSNSLCFCLAAGEIHPGTGVFEQIAATLVQSTHTATAQGVHRYDPVVTTADGVSLLRILHNNFYIEPSGRLAFSQPYLGRRFGSFRHYRTFLASSVAALFDNAMHPARRHALPPVAAVSRGYDSPAVAVLAREQGCREALTIGVEVDGREDSGLRIGEQLGLVVREFPHVAGRRIPALEMDFTGSLRQRAREFVATAGLGDDVTFLAFEPALARRVLLTGAWGDSIWTKGAQLPPDLRVRIRFGKSLTEYRLRLGFAHVPVPFLGGLFPASILAMSGSRDMAPYSVGGTYDRPIPRRIGEEAGLDRQSFGQAKTATSPDPLNRDELWRDAVAHVMARYAPVAASLPAARPKRTVV